MNYYLTYLDDGESFDYEITEYEAITAMSYYFAKQFFSEDQDNAAQKITSMLEKMYNEGSLDLDTMVNQHTQYIMEYFAEAAFSV